MITLPKTVTIVLRQEHEGFQFHKAFETKDWADKYLQDQDRRDNYETHVVPIYTKVNPEIEQTITALAKLTEVEKALLGLYPIPNGGATRS